MAAYFDVVVVGAGPAGSAVALSLRKHAPHLTVALADREVFPRDKSCGDGLGPGVVRALTSLDALEVVADAAKPTAVRVGGPAGYEGRAQGPTIRGKDLSGFVVPRKIFDARLAWLARDRGASLMEDMKFTSSTVDGDQRRVEFTRDGKTVDITARVLIGADGAYSRVRRELRVGKAEDRNTHIAMRAYAPIAVDGIKHNEIAEMRIDFHEDLLPAYGWVFPISADAANVGVGIPVTLLKDRAESLQSLLITYSASLEEHGVKIGRMENHRSHLLPHTAGMPRLAHDRAALVGDAASMINPLSGEGINYGMTAGIMLGRRLADSARPDDDNAALRLFEKEFRRRFRAHFWSCLVGHRLLRSPRWAETVIRACSRDQRVMEDAALLLFDEQRVRFGTSLDIIRSGLMGHSNSGRG